MVPLLYIQIPKSPIHSPLSTFRSIKQSRRSYYEKEGKVSIMPHKNDTTLIRKGG